jgi:hypothetical protein
MGAGGSLSEREAQGAGGYPANRTTIPNEITMSGLASRPRYEVAHSPSCASDKRRERGCLVLPLGGLGRGKDGLLLEHQRVGAPERLRADTNAARSAGRILMLSTMRTCGRSPFLHSR